MTRKAIVYRSRNNDDRLNYLDVTRAIAALLVITVHVSQLYTPQPTGFWTLAQMGQLGVQLFFVASAFTITASLERLSNEPNAGKLFFIFRFFRIAPLFYFGMIVYFLATQLTFFDNAPHIPRPENSFFNTISHVLLMNGIIPRGGNTLVPGEWSIGAECLFYIVAPLLYRIRNSPRIILVIGFFCILTIQLVTIAASKYYGKEISVENNGIMYFSIINQLPVFLSGICLYVNREKLFKISKSISWTAALISIFIIWIFWKTTFLGGLLFSIIPVIAAVASIFIIIALSKISRFPQFAIEFGRRSYSIYIFHFIIISTIIKLTDEFNIEIEFLQMLIITAIITYFVSGLSYKIVELPIIRFSKRLALRMSAHVLQVDDRSDKKLKNQKRNSWSG